MLVKLTPLKQINVKLADDAKEQFSKFIDERVPKNCEKFSLFAKFDQWLDTFMSQFLLNKKYEPLWEVSIIVFCLSHGQSGKKLQENTKNICQNEKQKITPKTDKDLKSKIIAGEIEEVCMKGYRFQSSID